MMWYKSSLDEIFKQLATNAEEGLSEDSAKIRVEKYGKNVLPRGKKVTWFQFLLRQFKSPLVYILVIGAAMTIYLKEWVDTTVILAAVVVNVSVGFWQEFRSNNILEKLREVVRTNALVIRDGGIHEINAEYLVPGDIIVLKTGNKVPADARVLESHYLEVDESILTGESMPVGKDNIEIKEDASIGDRENMVHMGTFVARGDGTAVVVATGADSAFGKIAVMTQQAEDEPTPLQIRMGRLGRTLAILIGVASVMIFVMGVIQDKSVAEMMKTAIAVAVAAIPEGLPAGISIVLAISAQKILKRKGVVKRLVAAEALGSASVICTDKTGTLTEGKMTVKHLVTGGDEQHARNILALANEAVIEEIGGHDVAKGETTDVAKLQHFLDNDGDIDVLNKNFPRISILTFNPENKYIASLHKDEDAGTYKIFLNGAPEMLLSISSDYISKEGNVEKLTSEEKSRLHTEFEELAAKGFRVLGIAEHTIKDLKDAENQELEDKETKEALIKNLTFIGFAAIRDPIRDDVRESIAQARAAGVKTIMMTGDHILTARAIGGELGFSTEDKSVMEGKVVEGMTDEELQELVKHAEIFARVNPEHKMRVIDALQRNGEVVAMTGDGINDAPALKSADIGVAVGSGTDIAKAASDLILLNDSFSIIVAAIRQGRIAFDNIRKVTVFLLAGSFTELILIMVPLMFGMEYLPVTAVMILWTNLIEDSMPNIALSFEPGEKGVMDRPPAKKTEPVLDSESKIIVFAVGVLTDIVLLGVFMFFYFQGVMGQEHLQTLIFAALGLDTFFYIYSIKNLRKMLFSYSLFDNKYLIGATVIGMGMMLVAIYVPFFNDALHTVPLTLANWYVILAIGIIEVVGVEVAKWYFIHRHIKEEDAVPSVA